MKKYSKKDIKAIKYEKRFGVIISVGILFLVAIGNLYALTNTEANTDLTKLILIDLAVIIASMTITYFINKKFNLDLKEGHKKIIIEKVEKKEDKLSYEAGSGSLYIGQEMKESTIFYLIIKGFKHDVEKNLYDSLKEGDNVNMYYTRHSEILLGIEKT